ncbi:ribbon-helix-helix domain-containing protein [Fodinibius sediminis]|uniref:Uncharacterized protein n=1 Tax=Fodinibius sediminis TaxID=1214077 RepID=A0A521AVG6_9BACT|nr:ribbon-helix-helix domain-containing protein [Fodinibius sediminis]SMO38826.1 hypothetical protein SAMN06265218_101409 [Fodinibius sediminis]
MADDEFNIEELISGPDGSGEDTAGSNTCNTNNTGATSTTKNASTTLHPFSVRLDQEYVETIKALAWWKRISQREFIEHCISYALEEMNEERLTEITNRYHEQSN